MFIVLKMFNKEYCYKHNNKQKKSHILVITANIQFKGAFRSRWSHFL